MIDVFIRTDSSVQIGIGHVMRCLTLADELRSCRVKVAFICKKTDGNINHFIEEKGFTVCEIFGETWKEDAMEVEGFLKRNGGAKWLIVDHYGLDIQWENYLREHCRRIMVIDDLANRHHDCDLLLDQNYYIGQEYRYKELVSNRCKQLIGSGNVLLRSEFRQAAKNIRKRDGSISRILIFMGGSDPANMTTKVLDAIVTLGSGMNVDVVVGSSNPNRESILKRCDSLPMVNFYCQTNSMAMLINNADLCIGAGGTTTWERGVLGLPTLTVVCSDIELQTTLDIAEQDAVWFLGCAHQINVDDIVAALNLALRSPNRLREIGNSIVSLLGKVDERERSTSADFILEEISENNGIQSVIRSVKN